MVRPRWSDMDAFGHVNHASMVTLLEEARVPVLFAEANKAGLAGFAKGMVVAKLSVDYRAPVVADGAHIRVEVSLRQLKFASLTLGYNVHNGASAADEVAVTAETVLAPYDTQTRRPRRLTDSERAFLLERLGPVETVR
ncbi:acyl-CoA thioesterase [Amycolatopsis taiwanensis]